MDNVLLPYLASNNEQERKQHLEELLAFRAGPLIRNVLLRRLGYYVSAAGINENNQDAEDLYQEAMARVLQVLSQLRSGPGVDIANFELYVSRLTTNICTDFLRTKTPAHTRLKYSLRELLKRQKDFASWERDGETLCGFASWRNTGKSASSDQSSEEFETRLDSFKSLYFAAEDIRLAPLPHVVAELFDWLSGPVEIDGLVRMIAYLLDIQDREMESLDNPSLAKWNTYFVSGTQAGDSHVAARELLGRLWRAVIKLPAEQRDSFALGFKDEAGQDLFTVLLAADIVSWDGLARGMGRSVADVVRLRLRMPMDTPGMAQELKVSRDNVYKWRFRAIKQLNRELRG